MPWWTCAFPGCWANKRQRVLVLAGQDGWQVAHEAAWRHWRATHEKAPGREVPS